RGHSTVESRIKKAALVALALCAFANTALAQQQPAQSRAPITKDNVVATLRGLTPERRDAGLSMLAAAIRDSGVDFEVTPAVEQELRDAGATPELIAAARANYRPSGAASQSASSTAARGPSSGAPPTEKDAAM